MKVNLTYVDFKAVINNKKLAWQWTETSKKYNIFALDNLIEYQTEVWKSEKEPKGCDVTQNTADRGDFETNYKGGANKKTDNTVAYQTQPIIGSTKPSIGSRAWNFSHDFCDRTSWYGDAIRVVDEAVGTGDGATTVFNLAHTFAVDVTHGKITDEDNLVPTATQGGSSYVPVVKVDGVTKTERPYPETSGGDYVIDYAAGTITFAVAPASGNAVTATYFYSPSNGSTMYVRAKTPGNKLVITMAECMFSSDFEMTNNLSVAIFTYNPALGAPPAKFEYPNTRTRYKNIYDFISWTNGAFPVIPAMGGSSRGLGHDILQLRYDYQTTIILPSSAGAEMRVWMENHTPFTGEAGAITFYGYEEAE